MHRYGFAQEPRGRRIRSYRHEIDGDDDVIVSRDEHPADPDEVDVEDGKTAVDLAVAFLCDAGVIEASSSSFHKDVWYVTEDQQNYRTGIYSYETLHLAGFTEDEQRAVYDRLKL